MKLKKIFFVIIFVFIYMQVFANTNPVVTNVLFSLTGTTVTITYDVTDAQQGSLTISMEVSEDAGSTWDYDFGSATGHIGAGVATGSNKTITWTYNGSSSGNVRIKIIADDLVGDQIYYSGQIYNTVTIGSQTWLKENLNIGTYINSTTGGTNSDGEQTDNGTIEKYAFNNDESNCDTYGGLYQWAEAVQYENGTSNTTNPSPAFSGNVEGICPSGWHIPTQTELQTLIDEEGGSSNALKAIDQGSGSGIGTNTSGYSILLSGKFNTNGSYSHLTTGTYIWTSSEHGATFAKSKNLNYYNNTVYGYNLNKRQGFSIRCIKD